MNEKRFTMREVQKKFWGSKVELVGNHYEIRHPEQRIDGVQVSICLPEKLHADGEGRPTIIEPHLIGRQDALKQIYGINAESAEVKMCFSKVDLAPDHSEIKIWSLSPENNDNNSLIVFIESKPDRLVEISPELSEDYGVEFYFTDQLGNYLIVFPLEDNLRDLRRDATRSYHLREEQFIMDSEDFYRHRSEFRLKLQKLDKQFNKLNWQIEYLENCAEVTYDYDGWHYIFDVRYNAKCLAAFRQIIACAMRNDGIYVPRGIISAEVYRNSKDGVVSRRIEVTKGVEIFVGASHQTIYWYRERI